MDSTANKPIDWPLCLKMANNKPELAKEMLELFMAELPTLQARISEAHSAADLQALQQHVHKLHGAACYCGVPKVKIAAHELETKLKTGIKSELDLLLEVLNEEIDAVIAAFEAQDFADS